MILRRRAASTLLAMALPATLLLAACRQDHSSQRDRFVQGNSQIQGHYSHKDGKLQLLTYDSNKNGKIDTWAYTEGATIVRIEIDTNEDGKIDRWEYYTPEQRLEKVGLSRGDTGRPDAWAFQGADGSLARMDIAEPCPSSTVGTGPAVDPGLITRREFYANGVLVRAEQDTNCDGRTDKWETFRDGALLTVAFDTTGRGVPDRRLVYAADGSAIEETDSSGTGQLSAAGQSHTDSSSTGSPRRR